MPRFKGRSLNACHYCRSQKVKCSGEQPCARCRSSQRACVYSSRERVITVPESYLRRLESELKQLQQPIRDDPSALAQTECQFTTPSSRGLESQAIPDRLIENSTTEHFVRKLKHVYSTRSLEVREPSLPSPSFRSDCPNVHDNDNQSACSDYTYIPLESDNSHPKVLVKLPPHSYALYLLGQFETFMGSDYHWYKKKQFRARIEATYDTSKVQAVDRVWLCCFSVVLALGESYNDGIAPSFLIDERSGIPASKYGSPDQHQISPPGIAFFQQALLLFRASYEEPTIEQVEALNLITFYCYSLNRRKTAYAYAGMALRLANLLRLPNSPAAKDPVEVEHCKRIWWTTVCMDIMTCTELSLTPAHALNDDTNAFPGLTGLSPNEAEEFSDARYLTAQVKLIRIKYQIINAISELRYGNAVEAHALIEPCLQVLHKWKEEFPLNLVFNEDGGYSIETLSDRSMRTIASLLLRYNQCFIILLRPLLLKQLQDIVHQENALIPNHELTSLNMQCLQAAANNATIQFALSKCHRIALFGFWDSLHIFSGLTVHMISSFIERKSSLGPTSTSASANAPFGPVREILEKMAEVGNAASKDHKRMIDEIENILLNSSSRTDLTGGIEDLAEWSNYLDSDSIGFAFDETFPSFGWS